MPIKTGEQILKGTQWEKIVEIIKENNCPQEFGLLECNCGTYAAKGFSSCCIGWDNALAMKYDDQGNGVYVPIEEADHV
jgi:hypothetical protein